MRDDRPTILRVVPTLDFGGVESLLEIQAALHDRARYDLRVLTFWKAGRAAERIRAMGIPVDTLRVAPAVRSAVASLALARYVRQAKPDVLHASVPEATFHAGFVGRASGARRVILDDAGMPNGSRLRRVISSAVYRSADGAIAVSRALADHLVEALGARRDRVHVIPTCAAPHFFEYRKDSYAVDRRPFSIVMVGRLTEVKNHRVVIDAVSRLVAEGREIELTIFGEGPLREVLERRIDEGRIRRRASMPGYADDLVTALLAADAYLLPSLSEGCSLSLIEAMALGLPSLASDVPGNREVLGESFGESLVALNATRWSEALARLIDLGAEGRRGLGEGQARHARESYSPSAYLKRLDSVYQRYLGFDARAWEMAS